MDHDDTSSSSECNSLASDEKLFVFKKENEVAKNDKSESEDSDNDLLSNSTDSTYDTDDDENSAENKKMEEEMKEIAEEHLNNRFFYKLMSMNERDLTVLVQHYANCLEFDGIDDEL